jgi:hypothetical protein
MLKDEGTRTFSKGKPNFPRRIIDRTSFPENAIGKSCRASGRKVIGVGIDGHKRRA